MAHSEFGVIREPWGHRTVLRPLQAEHETKPKQRPVVLLADDDHSVRRLCSRALGALDITVVEAANGTDAIGLWDRMGGGFEAVVLDLCMPGATGIQVLQHMRRTMPLLPAVFISGSGIPVSDLGVPEDLAALDNVAFLDKPFRLNRLRELVRKAVGSE